MTSSGTRTFWQIISIKFHWPAASYSSKSGFADLLRNILVVWCRQRPTYPACERSRRQITESSPMNIGTTAVVGQMRSSQGSLLMMTSSGAKVSGGYLARNALTEFGKVPMKEDAPRCLADGTSANRGHACRHETRAPRSKRCPMQCSASSTTEPSASIKSRRLSDQGRPVASYRSSLQRLTRPIR